MRNNNLDVFRGIAVISVIFIHTAFQSGALYIPEYIRSLSLLIDVPLFIFISGYSFSYVLNYKKILTGILKLYRKYFYFVLLYSVVIIILDGEKFSILNFINWLFFSYPESNILISVGGTIWFWPLFIKISLICPLIISVIMNGSDEKKHLNNLILVFMVCSFLYLFSEFNDLILNRQILMYSAIYLLGFIASKIRIKSFKNLLLLLFIDSFIIIFLLYYQSYTILNMQTLKFQYNTIYLLYSFICIFIIWYLNDKIQIKPNLFSFIGKNAIWFYLAQGVSSSLCYFIVPYILSVFNWYITMAIVFIANFIMACFISSVLKYFYTYYDKIYNYGKKLVCSCFTIKDNIKGDDYVG